MDDTRTANALGQILVGRADDHAFDSRILNGGIVRFSLPIFEHIYQHRRTGAVMMGMRGRAVVHDHLQRTVAEQIADDMKRHLQGRRKAAAAKIPQDLLAQYIAGVFILVLNWWADCRHPLPPTEADAIFRALLMPTLTAALQ